VSALVGLPLPLRERVGERVAPGETIDEFIALAIFDRLRRNIFGESAPCGTPLPNPPPARGEGTLPPVCP